MENPKNVSITWSFIFIPYISSYKPLYRHIICQTVYCGDYVAPRVIFWTWMRLFGRRIKNRKQQLAAIIWEYLFTICFRIGIHVLPTDAPFIAYWTVFKTEVRIESSLHTTEGTTHSTDAALACWIALLEHCSFFKRFKKCLVPTEASKRRTTRKERHFSVSKFIFE